MFDMDGSTKHQTWERTICLPFPVNSQVLLLPNLNLRGTSNPNHNLPFAYPNQVMFVRGPKQTDQKTLPEGRFCAVI